MKMNFKNLFLIILISVSAMTRFVFLGYPSEVVFDEVHYGKYVSGYFTGEYFFDVHPPFAKLLMAGVGFLGGFAPTADFGEIGNSLFDVNFIWLRFLPSLVGFLLPLVIYYLCRALNFSKIASGTAAALVIFENSLITQSRFILPDIFLLFFGFLGLLCYFLYRKYVEKQTRRYLLILAVLFAVFAFSVKWTGLTFFCVIMVLEVVFLVQKKAKFKEWCGKLAMFAGVAFITYFSIFAIHFAFLTKDGEGREFMSLNFQKTLVGNQYENDKNIKSSGTWAKFFELNKEMYQANNSIGEHPYGSKWHSWPLMKRPIYYWVSITELSEAKIYLLGNPFIYWIGLVAVLFLSTYLFFSKNKAVVGFLLAGYLLNLLPFIFIDRVMFLYHYFPALIFSIMIIAFLIDEMKSEKIKLCASVAIILLAMIMFVYFSPLTYGISLPKDGLNQRFWFDSWQ